MTCPRVFGLHTLRVPRFLWIAKHLWDVKGVFNEPSNLSISAENIHKRSRLSLWIFFRWILKDTKSIDNSSNVVFCGFLQTPQVYLDYLSGCSHLLKQMGDAFILYPLHLLDVNFVHPLDLRLSKTVYICIVPFWYIFSYWYWRHFWFNILNCWRLEHGRDRLR